jgi:enamine deaminase RidA (YjgF/YER057c/UK114 family)
MIAARIYGGTQEDPRRDQLFLSGAGTDKSRLLSTQIWLKDITKDLVGMNKIWGSWTATNAPPTRATAQCKMGAPDVLVQIIVIAVVSQ